MRRNLVRIFLLGFLLVTRLAFAEGDLFVQEVQTKGLHSVPEETIRAKLETHAGRMTNRAILANDIKTLFKIGAFQDIQVDEERGERGWIYTFIFVERPVISKVSFEGNKKVKTSELRDLSKIPLYQPLNEEKVAETMQKFRDAYEKKNYYLVEIRYQLKPTPDKDYELLFTIKEHQIATIRQVNFIGNKVFTDAQLRKTIKTRGKGAFSFVTKSGKYEEEELDHDVGRLTFHYLKNGYLKVKVKKPRIELSKDKKYFFVSFQVDEGDRYHIGAVDAAGDILTTKVELLDGFLTKPQQVYNRENIERDIQALTKRYADQGYAFVNIQPQTTTNEVVKTADITYQIEKGSRVWIEKIKIIGNTITRDKVIRRELELVEGDLYNESKLEKSREKIRALGYFKDINFATPRGSADDMVELDITVEEQPTGQFNIGAGFSTAEDFIFNAGVQKQNFFGRGWSGNVSAELSSRRQQFMLSGVDPYFLDSGWILGVSAYRSIYRFGSVFEGSFDRESYGGGLSLGHRFFDYSSVSLGYDAEQVSATDLESFVPQRFRDNASGLTSMVSLTVNRDTRDNRIYAKKGTFFSAKNEISGSKLGGDNNFFRTSGRAQWYQPVVGKLNFKTFGRIGYIKSLNAQVVPLFERFYLGGPNSLRGFIPQAVGPKETVTKADGTTTDFTFGGDKMAVLNAELEYPIVDTIGFNFVTFFDAGNTYGEGRTLDLNDLRYDWGFGLRWISPMGPMRFEWGFPLDKQADERDVVFNFTIGTFF